MNLAELELLARFPGWEWFGTLTFAGRVGSERKCRAFAINYFHRVAKALGISNSSLMWVLREEEGEIGGRRHFHFLLGTSQKLPMTIAGIAILERIWTRVGRGRGFAKVRAYDKALSGVSYVTKCLSTVATPGAASYEVKKFGTSREPLVFSDSLVRRLARMMEPENRRSYAVSPGATVKSHRGCVKAVGICGSTVRRGPGELPRHNSGQDEKSGEWESISSRASASNAPF
jgi:hypothetical protein